MTDLHDRVGLDELREYCEFGPGRVYVLMAIARAKENEGTTSNSEHAQAGSKRRAGRGEPRDSEHAQAGSKRRAGRDDPRDSEPVIREIVEDAGALERTIEQLDHAVSRFDSRFRLYLSANARDTTRAFFELRDRMDDWIEMRLRGNEDVIPKFGRIDSEFKSVLQSDTCKDETNFIFDLDEVTDEEAAAARERLREHTSVRLVRATPNGFHVVTESFNYTELDVTIEYELKTDGMIFLAYVGE